MRKPSPTAATGLPPLTSIAVLASGCDLGSGLEAGLGDASSGGRAGALRAEPAEQSQAKPLIPNAALIAVAERCEAATRPDRGLDVDIADALGNVRVNAFGDLVFVGGRCKHGALTARRYTASLDAAMTLVPEGCGVDLRIPRLPGGRAADLWAINGLAGAAKAATPALALCAAALRARAAQ